MGRPFGIIQKICVFDEEIIEAFALMQICPGIRLVLVFPGLGRVEIRSRRGSIIMSNKTMLSSVLAGVFLLLGLTSVSEAEFAYKTAKYEAEKSCGNRYPSNSKYEKASHNLIKKGCWACPKGFKRSALPVPDKHKSCKKPRAYKNAIFHSHAGGLLKNVCKGKPWLKDKKCWTCPAGFKRSLKKVAGKPQCKPVTKFYYHAATRRGDAGCADGQWSPKLSGKCYSCPAGYFRNPVRVSLDRTQDHKACMTYVASKKQKLKFIKTYSSKAGNVMKDNKELVELAGNFVKNLKRIRKQRGITGSYSKMGKQEIIDAGGVELAAAANEKGLASVTISGGGDGSYGVGLNGSAGMAFGLVEEGHGTQDGSDVIDNNKDLGLATVVSVNGSIGASVGGDVSINVGFWKPSFNELGGFAHGIVLGGAYNQYGMNGSVWWAITFGDKDEYAGFSVGYQGGKSAEAEYNWGYTWQKEL